MPLYNNDISKAEVLYASAARTGNQTLSTSTSTTIVAMQGASGDMTLDGSGGMVVPTGNFYAIVTAGIRWSAHATGMRIATIMKNAANVCLQSVEAVSTATIPTYMTISDNFPVTTGDVIYLRGAQNSGGNLDVDYNTGTFMRVVLIPYI